MRRNWARVLALTVSFAYVLWLILYLAMAFMGNAGFPSGAVNYVILIFSVSVNVFVFLNLLARSPAALN